MKNTILILGALFLVSCSAQSKNSEDRIGASRKEKTNIEIPTETRHTSCICTKIYMPVCGTDNRTYSNSCVAECSGVKEYTMGRCEDRK